MTDDWTRVDALFEETLESVSEAPRDPLLESGEPIGAYRLLERIGTGGMGAVYLAERADGQFEQRVAIKVVRTSPGNESLVERFLRERQILARLQHANIARLYDGGLTPDGRPYFVMEFVDGVPLAEHCAREDVDRRACLELLVDVARAVDYAHGHGVIHRDLKPSNILVTRDGRPMLLDFGIARLHELDDSITRTGEAVLTPAYASPEQSDGREITAASDVYQLGVILYEVLSGRRPLGSEPDPPGVVAGARRPTDLDRICLKALRPEPEDRYGSCGALADDIDRYLRGRPVTAAPDTPLYRTLRFVARNRAAVNVAAALVVLSVLVGYLAGGGASTGGGPLGVPAWALAVIAVALGLALAATLGRRRLGPEGDSPPAAVRVGSGAYEDESGPRGPRVSAPKEGAGTKRLEERTVAVLPFEDLTGGEGTGPFAVGLHDDLLTELSRVASLAVIARASVAKYRDTDRSITRIGRDLGAGTIVQGTVRRAGDRVRLNIQLVDSRTNAHRWAERYDRELTAENIFDLQTELAAMIATTLRAELTTDEREAAARPRRPPTGDLEAYRLYANGRTYMMHRSRDMLEEAVASFGEAVERDPEYAPAWAELANALILQGDYVHEDPADVFPRGERAAHTALDLDPELAEAHSALGNLRSALRQASAAIPHHERAIELRPGYAQAFQWLAWCRLLIGDGEGALEAGRRATRLDPLDGEGGANFACAHLACDDPEGAVRECRRLAELGVEGDYRPWVEGSALYRLGRDEEAARRFTSLTESWARSWPDVARALSHHGAGEDGRTADIVRGLEDSRPFYAGLIGALLGEPDRAFARFDRAGQLGWSETLFVRYVLPDLAPSIPEDERYDRFMAAIDRSWGMDETAGLSPA